ncbi:acyl-CoA carboxylase subunit beta [Corynebacterium uropygiale]|uniref:Acyl-CoA carboxylase subunit beta n=1 Tax=Corynebacterium uropygiale TaxID=1775911 RepID=A0A9X1TXG1_9CORY|nr:acyl-CoA carboxylase subunit beta [Corynebacterium uropygiale]MCF4006035.1 acyl-CoA carboxylase subunit beta [Corynebacterium uropygiale]
MTAADIDLKTTAGKIADLSSRLKEAHAPLGEESIEHIHAAGRSTARERIEALLDEGSFVEIDALARHRATDFAADKQRPATDGVVAGYGTVEGRKVCVFAQDGTIFDGQMGEVHGEKIIKVIELAAKTGVPLIGFHEGAGARLVEGIVPLAMQARILRLLTRASGLVPHIAVLSGETSGAQAFIPSLADILVMVGEEASLHLTEPDVVRTVTGVETDALGLGGPEVHLRESGTAHLSAGSDSEATDTLRDLLSRLPVNNRALAPRVEGGVEESAAAELDALIPDSSSAPYDMKDVLRRVVDDGDLLELQAEYAPNIITALARIDGRSVGIVANQPTEVAGCLNDQAAAKAARFLRTMDSFNLPIVEFVDVPGFQPALEEEHGTVLRRGASLAYAYAEAEVGKVTVIVRRAMGPGYVLMGSKDLGADLVYAWPTAEIAAQEASGAVRTLYRSELEKAARQGKDTDEMMRSYEQEYAEKYVGPYIAAERGLVDAVIPPSETRKHLIDGLELLDRKISYPPAKKHGNMPL